jgi:hypothetical protein
MNRSDEKFVKEAKAWFDGSVDELDAATLSTLNQRRHRALEELHRPQQQWLRWAPATGVAVAVLVAVLVTQPEPVVTELPVAAADIEILLGEESIEMLEDLEFYALIDQLEPDDDVG